MLAMLLLNRMSISRQNLKKKAIKSIKSQNNATKDICRTCLGTEDLVSIFYNKETAKKRTDDLRLVTGLEIQINDGLSQKICKVCVDVMDAALRFRRMSRKSEKTLRAMLTGQPQQKMSKRLLKPVVPKVENMITKKEIQDPKVELDYNYESLGDDFRIDYEDDTESVGLKDVKQEQKTSQPVKKKRTVVPNASSYKCATCNKEFRMKATYKAHIRFHTNYCVCESCGKRCRNNNQLQEHKRARHGLGRIHSCTYCEYTAATKEALTIHERRHTGERPYICDHCGATFHRRSNLVQHIAIHLPEKNFQCSKCPKRVKSRKFLMIHESKAHREKKYRYICPICHDTFARPGNVRQHLVRTHSIRREHQGVIDKIKITMPITEEVHKDDAIYVYI